MKCWEVQEATARFREFLEASLSKGPQIVTRLGVEAAVLVPIDEWRRLQRAAKPSLKELLLSEQPCGNIVMPRRGSRHRRSPATFD